MKLDTIFKIREKSSVPVIIRNLEQLRDRKRGDLIQLKLDEYFGGLNYIVFKNDGKRERVILLHRPEGYVPLLETETDYRQIASSRIYLPRDEEYRKYNKFLERNGR